MLISAALSFQVRHWALKKPIKPSGIVLCYAPPSSSVPVFRPVSLEASRCSDTGQGILMAVVRLVSLHCTALVSHGPCCFCGATIPMHETHTPLQKLPIFHHIQPGMDLCRIALLSFHSVLYPQTYTSARVLPRYSANECTVHYALRSPMILPKLLAPATPMPVRRRYANQTTQASSHGWSAQLPAK